MTTYAPDTALGAFVASARRRPDHPALVYFDTELTFRELDEQSDALAAVLQGWGVARGDRVAAYLQNVPQFPLAALAAWKAGATLTAINPMLRHRELRGVLDDSGSTVLVTLESLWEEVAAEVVPETAVRHAITTSELDFLDEPVPDALAHAARRRPTDGTDDLVELIAAHRGEAASATELDPADVALLTYTSGTTGPAKGAMNTQGNMAFAGRVYRDAAGIGDDDVILAIAPLFHITGLTAHLALGLVAGIPLLLSYRFDPDLTLELIERRRATFTVASITAYIAMMNAATSGDRDVSSLRLGYSGGAPISPATVAAWRERFGTTIWPVYGLTETTGPTHLVPPGADAPVDPVSGALSIGLPVASTITRVLDESGAEVPVGEHGEIAISGPQVVPGYWGKPAESAAAFPGGEMLTGDIGFMDAEGWFYIVDRKKDLINAAGYKVWPREVEDVLLAHPAVREAAVVGVPDEYRGETVKAFVSLKAAASASGEELIGFCRERMAAYKYPRSVEVLDELPKSATGKILRRELRDA